MTTVSPTSPRLPAIPECHLRQTGLRLEDVRAFRREGVLALRGLLDPDELGALRDAAATLIDWAWSTGTHPDVVWTRDPTDPAAAPIRIEYPVDKSVPMRLLAGHPLLLEVAEALVGPNLVPTWDSMVFKTEAGAPRLAWHRDGEMYPAPTSVTGGGRVIDVGVYLDPAPEGNCVWAIPGSNYWSDERVTATADRLNASAWDTTGAVPAPMRPGDVLVHNILTLHAAPAVTGARRRVVYFEYRPAEVEWHLGPHDHAYVGRKQQVLRACVRQRARERPEERPFQYRPAQAMRHWDDHAELTTYRFPHQDHWTWSTYS
jgi:phytanoyl-CoA hydroxylase